MKTLAFIVVIVILAGTAAQLYQLQIERWELQKSVQKITNDLKGIEDENKKLQEEIVYLGNTKNLEREARAQFNYALPNEKLIIVVKR